MINDDESTIREMHQIRICGKILNDQPKQNEQREVKEKT